MKTIIAGTDFTPSSINACRYAALLAKKLNCKLTLFNLYDAPIVHSNSGLYGISFTAQKTLSYSAIEKVTKKIKEEFPTLKVDHFISGGSYKEVLDEFIASHLIEAVVMGLGAKDRISKFIYGSHGVNIAAKIDSPVIIVPEKYKAHHLSDILLAVDNQEKLKKSDLLAFERFVKLTKSKLGILHIRSEDELFSPEQGDIKISGKKIPVEMIKAKEIESGIKKYSHEKSVDLITVISKKHSVFYNLFVESATKKIAFASKVPVMAIHS